MGKYYCIDCIYFIEALILPFTGMRYLDEQCKAPQNVKEYWKKRGKVSIGFPWNLNKNNDCQYYKKEKEMILDLEESQLKKLIEKCRKKIFVTCRCGNEKGILDFCPFNQDLGFEEKLCICCKKCRYDCVQEV